MQIKRRQSCSPIPSECENEQCMQIFIAGGFIMVMVVILILVAFVLVSAFTLIVANVNIILIQVLQRSTFL